MPDDALSRRRFLAVAGLGTAAVLGACAITATPVTTPGGPTSTPNPSPAAPGPYLTHRLILGEELGTTAMSNPYTLSQLPSSAFQETDFNTVCQNGKLVPIGSLPAHVLAAVYYPYYGNGTDHRVPTPNLLDLRKGPYPVLLYAHGYRPPGEACPVASPLDRDFTTVDAMLSHVASYGCVCVAPDLSWLPGARGSVYQDAYQDAINLRATVLVEYYNYLIRLNTTLFAQQLDLSRVVFVGHSTGGPAATRAGHILSPALNLRSLAYGLIAPIPGGVSAEDHNLLVLRGGKDTMQGADPQGAYTAGAAPKSLVTIPGANHFGYTDLCDANNVCAPYGIRDPNGGISLANQQLAGGSYLAALLRYYTLGDASALPYLTGRTVEGLEGLNIQVQSQGLTSTIVPTQPAQP